MPAPPFDRTCLAATMEAGLDLSLPPPLQPHRRLLPCRLLCPPAARCTCLHSPPSHPPLDEQQRDRREAMARRQQQQLPLPHRLGPVRVRRLCLCIRRRREPQRPQMRTARASVRRPHARLRCLRRSSRPRLLHHRRLSCLTPLPPLPPRRLCPTRTIGSSTARRLHVTTVRSSSQFSRGNIIGTPPTNAASLMCGCAMRDAHSWRCAFHLCASV